jgi:hypothetical protein
MIISFFGYAVLDGGKYFPKFFYANSYQVVMTPTGKEFSHAFTFSLSE